MTLNNYDNTLVCFANVTSALTVPNGTPVKIRPIDAIQRHQVEHIRLVDRDISNHLDNVMKAIAITFPKLRGIRLGNVSIGNVSKRHLESFPELELLSLDNNKIEVLESDMFMYTPKLKFIYFDYNLIAKVDDNLLKTLDYVEVDFSSNPCIQQGTCKSELHHEKLKEKNPTLYHYYELGQAIDAVLQQDPNYGR